MGVLRISLIPLSLTGRSAGTNSPCELVVKLRDSVGTAPDTVLFGFVRRRCHSNSLTVHEVGCSSLRVIHRVLDPWQIYLVLIAGSIVGSLGDTTSLVGGLI